MENFITLKNNQTIPLQDIPVLAYPEFLELNISLVKEDANHCVNYYGFPVLNTIKLICCIADDAKQNIYVSSSVIEKDRQEPLTSFTARKLCFHLFERELHENFAIPYYDHPWLKPVRYPIDRPNQENTISNYPFYQIHSEELHEVGVGPIHAGIIEPGHFRFICNGEQILHLEIQLGYQ
ncbi:hypothetical protein, partial [Arcticibacter svalbardensis]|uniref:hypothetical protein n=1 Tax=Arcticibacter svalbardensis TaxID=1288027 RepID=UPI0005902D7F